MLGENLISDQAVGLIELVKNCYDADATEVRISLKELRNPLATEVTVEDNGCGMTQEDIELRWLSPAVDFKERAKRANQRSALGRLPIGEKGVGRFAVQQMAHRFEMITRAADHPELVVEINWDDFEDGDLYLDSVQIKVIARPPQVFVEGRTGTVLRMKSSRDPWTPRLVSKVHRTLRRLQSPLRDVHVDFTLSLTCPEYPEYENLSTSDILERSHYTFRAWLDPDGRCDFEYVCAHPDVPSRTKSGSESLVKFAGADISAPTKCGPFYFNMYVWDRSRDSLQRSNISRQELDALCGVSVFRDGLRVLPYGEPGDDWLYLDQERIQAPAERIGNNQVIGMVQLDQSDSLQLRDKTNREGLIENQAFQDLRALVRAAIRLFITYWRKDRPTQDGQLGKVRQGSLERATSVAQALNVTASPAIHVEIPPAALPPPESVPPDIGDAAPAKVSQQEAVRLLLDELTGANTAMREQQAHADLLLHLAATGLAAERVVHEFGRQVQAAEHALNNLQPIVPSQPASIEALAILATCLQTLKNEFRVLAPYESVGRNEYARQTSVHWAADLALSLSREAFDEADVAMEITGEDFLVRMAPTPLIQILDNLTSNALYWASNAGVIQPSIRVSLSKTARTVTVQDNGPGVHEEAVDSLFSPFFSMKPDGKGLGLYIATELARKAHARLTLLPNDPASPGAAFVLSFGPDGGTGKEGS